MSVCRGSTVIGPAKLRKYEHENKTRRNWGEEGPEHFNKIQMIYYSPQKAEKTLNSMKKTHPFNTDSSLLGTVFFVPGESPYMFFKFNPLNTDTFNDPSVSVLTWFDCTT